MKIEPCPVERSWAADGVPVLTAEGALPQPSSAPDACARRLRRYYRLQSRAFLRYCGKILLPQARAAHQAALLFFYSPVCCTSCQTCGAVRPSQE